MADEEVPAEEIAEEVEEEVEMNVLDALKEVSLTPFSDRVCKYINVEPSLIFVHVSLN